MYHPSSESLLLPYKHKSHPSSLHMKPPHMCTPWTFTHLLARRRVKGRSNSTFRRDDESNRPVVTAIQNEQSNDAQPSSSSPRQGGTTTAYPPALVPSRVSVIKRRVTIGSNQTSSSSASSLGDGGADVDDTDWPPFTDEDYIVFCFEEDGDFHVVKDENLKSQDCSDHGYSPRPLNQKNDNNGDSASPASRNNANNYTNCRAVEEERFYFSPRLQSDGIKSLTRFKAETNDEDEIVQARSRVDEEMDYEDMDGIKRRVQSNEDEEDMMCDNDLECHKTSMECRDGSVESAGSSQPDWVRQLQVTKTDQEIGLSSSSQAQEDPSPSKNGKPESPVYIREILQSNKTGDDEESLYLSSESQQGGSQGDEEESARESAETSDTGQLEEDEETAKCSTSSSSSFEFPVLKLEWSGSPVKWPKSKSISMGRHKSHRVRLRCCRF